MYTVQYIYLYMYMYDKPLPYTRMIFQIVVFSV